MLAWPQWSLTGSNLFGISKEFQLEPLDNNLGLLRSTILESTSAVPNQDFWRIRCLKNFLVQKYTLDAGYTSGYFRDERLD